MNGVLGMSELLLDTRLEPVQKRFVESIHRSAASLLAIVDDVLDFSKIEAGRLQLAPVECDLVELVEQTAEVLAARADAKNVELLCDCPAGRMPRVRADTVRLRQILVNLGSNAVKFTDRGEVTLRLAPLHIEAEALRVRLEVVDTGIGIEPENQARIFEEFVQEDASTTRRFGGTGLGLAIARQLVELMGGRLALVSIPGAGSTFSFEVSLQLAEPADRIAPPAADLQGLSVLVVDDNAAARNVLVSALSQWGARPVAAASFGDLEQALRADAYNVVTIDDSVLDARALARLRELLSQRVPRPRVLRLASLSSLAHVPVAGEPWFDAYLTKPIRLARLHDAVIGSVADPGAAGTAEPRPPLLPKLRGRALLVEDQSVNRDVAEGMLRALGLQVESAVDGRQALEMLAPGRFDVVLMDCQMPVMDGFSATKELRRRQGAEAGIPVIALTADTTTAAREACFAAGMNDYLGKPFNRASLRSVLARWLPAETDERPITEQYG
jgi:two-component system sensor histidine kinase/response regulator